MKSRTTSGNALFMILIAIALLGGLTVLMSRTGSQSDDTGDAEQLSIKVSNFLREAAGIQTAIQSLMMRGCGENQISFWTDDNKSGAPDTGDTYYNANAPADFSCHVFHVNGTGLNPPKIFPVEFQSGSALDGMGTSCSQSRCTDLYIHKVFTGSDGKRICETINRHLGHTTLIPLITADTAWGGSLYRGTFGAGYTPNSTLSGKAAACYHWNSDNYIFYYTLIAR